MGSRSNPACSSARSQLNAHCAASFIWNFGRAFCSRCAMFVTGVGDLRKFLDGQKLLVFKPIRSGFFVITGLVGMLAFLVSVYVDYRLWLRGKPEAAFAFGGLICIQIIYQWWRTLGYYAIIRKLYSLRGENEAKEGPSIDAALRIAVGGNRFAILLLRNAICNIGVHGGHAHAAQIDGECGL